MQMKRILLYDFLFLSGNAPSPGNATNHNHATAVTGASVTGSGGSNFKRQNTVDAATIKENSARVSASRPSAPKNSQSPGQLDTSEFTLFFNFVRRISLSIDLIDYLSCCVFFMMLQQRYFFG